MPLIKVIVPELSWYVISFTWSWPNEIKFELHLVANTTLWSLIVIPFESRIETVLISSVRMTWPTTVIKSIFLA